MRIQIGNTKKEFADISDRGCRTEKQYQTFLGIIPEIQFLCNNPFEQDTPDENYKCSFALTFYNLENKLCCYWITPTGRIPHKIKK